MHKIACESCGRKVTIDRDPPRAPMRYCPRCGSDLPTSEG